MTVITFIHSNKKGNKIIGRYLIKGYGFDVIVKDKTIKSPVIQSRYTRRNWCVALWRAGKCGLCEGWRGFGKHREHGEKDGLHHPSHPSRQSHRSGSNFRRTQEGTPQ